MIEKSINKSEDKEHFFSKWRIQRKKYWLNRILSKHGIYLNSLINWNVYCYIICFFQHLKTTDFLEKHKISIRTVSVSQWIIGYFVVLKAPNDYTTQSDLQTYKPVSCSTTSTSFNFSKLPFDVKASFDYKYDHLVT